MELLNLTVPKDKCPLDFLAEMEERCKNAWIYIHESVVQKLQQSEGVIESNGCHGFKIFEWEATNEYPETQLVFSPFVMRSWYIIVAIKAEDIAFKEIHHIEDPEYIIRLKMAE